VRANAALGGISKALALGEAILKAEPKGGRAVVEAICGETQGTILARGKVAKKGVVYTPEAFDIGIIEVAGKSSSSSPLRLSATPVTYDAAPPGLGEHTDSVLADVLDCSPDEIVSLRSRGIV